MEDNTGKQVTITCSHCRHAYKVALLQVSNHEQVECPACGEINDLRFYDKESEKITRKNQKELDKLRKLRGG